jgi:hypothetical protein
MPRAAPYCQPMLSDHSPRFEYLQDPSLLEIADQLEEAGYPGQADKVREGRLQEVADWLLIEQGYVKSGAKHLRYYARQLQDAAALESQFHLDSAGD